MPYRWLARCRTAVSPHQQYQPQRRMQQRPQPQQHTSSSACPSRAQLLTAAKAPPREADRSQQQSQLLKPLLPEPLPTLPAAALAALRLLPSGAKLAPRVRPLLSTKPAPAPTVAKLPRVAALPTLPPPAPAPLLPLLSESADAIGAAMPLSETTRPWLGTAANAPLPLELKDDPVAAASTPLGRSASPNELPAGARPTTPPAGGNGATGSPAAATAAASTPGPRKYWKADRKTCEGKV